MNVRSVLKGFTGVAEGDGASKVWLSAVFAGVG
jgi:hypothetical protein